MSLCYELWMSWAIGGKSYASQLWCHIQWRRREFLRKSTLLFWSTLYCMHKCTSVSYIQYIYMCVYFSLCVGALNTTHLGDFVTLCAYVRCRFTWKLSKVIGRPDANSHPIIYCHCCVFQEGTLAVHIKDMMNLKTAHFTDPAWAAECKKDAMTFL